MKKVLLLITWFFSITIINAQSPSSFNYQAVIRNNDGNLIISQSVGVQIDILQSSSSGSSVYKETHVVSTNEYGVLNLKIGSGSSSDSFASINWLNGPYFIQIKADIAGGDNYQLIGTSQVLSVPYALYASNCATLSFPEGINGTSVNIPAGEDYTVPAGKTLYIPQANGVDLNGEDCSYHCPAVIKENNVINSGYLITGFLVDKNLEIVNINSTQGDYTVPSDKTLYILSKGFGSTLKINGVEYFPNIDNVLIIKSSSVVSGVFTGYLK